MIHEMFVGQVDFGSQPPRMLKPRDCVIRRKFEDGVWLQYRSSAHQLQFHMKIHHLQVGNKPKNVASTLDSLK